MAKTKISEEDLAEIVVSYLEEQGWEVYQEVQLYRRGRTADIVATKGNQVWVVEVKQTLNLDVLSQALYWKSYATYSSIAVPKIKRKVTSGRRFAYMVMKNYNIGMIEINYPRDQAREWIPKKENKKADTRRFGHVLTERHKTYAKAGNAQGKKLTPYKITCERIKKYVDTNPGCFVKVLVANIAHHYSSRQSAIGSIKKRAKLGHIPDIVAIWSPQSKDFKLWTKEQKKKVRDKKELDL